MLRLLLILLMLAFFTLPGLAADDVAVLQATAEKGDVDAQLELGILYRDDAQGADVNYVSAAKWFRKASEQGNVDAQQELGSLYKYGLGVEQDYAEALKWLRKAAEHGCAEAQFKISGMYQQGQGVTEDVKEANRWMTKYSDQVVKDISAAKLSPQQVGEAVKMLTERSAKIGQEKERIEALIATSCGVPAYGNSGLDAVVPKDALTFVNCAEPLLRKIKPVTSCPDIYEGYLKRYKKALSNYHDGNLSQEGLLTEQVYMNSDKTDECLVRLEQKYHIRLH